MRRSEAYKIKRGDNLGDPDFWNKRLEDIDLRLHARELDGERIGGAIEDIQAAALQRLNDTLTPIINEAIDRLASVGALFEGRSDSVVEVGLGERSFVLTGETRTGYVLTDYVVIRALDENDQTVAALIAQTVGYDRENGLLTVDVALTQGAGTYNAWQIRVSAPPDIDHATRTDNPHATSAEQVGAYTKDEVDAIGTAIVSSLMGEIGTKASSAALTAGLNGKANASHSHSTEDIVGLDGALESYVAKTGAETIDGIKTFSSIPVLPNANPTAGNQAARKQYVDDVVKITRTYESSQQTMTAAGLLTLAHGMGMKPKFISMAAVCQVAEHGYSVGDEIFIHAFTDTAAQSVGVTVRFDTTNLYIRFGASGFFIFNASGGSVLMTLANWRLIARACA